MRLTDSPRRPISTDVSSRQLWPHNTTSAPTLIRLDDELGDKLCELHDVVCGAPRPSRGTARLEQSWPFRSRHPNNSSLARSRAPRTAVPAPRPQDGRSGRLRPGRHKGVHVDYVRDGTPADVGVGPLRLWSHESCRLGDGLVPGPGKRISVPTIGSRRPRRMMSAASTSWSVPPWRARRPGSPWAG
jgi:hypothetical protein